MSHTPPVLFETILGKQFGKLPQPIRRMHQFQTKGKAQGFASVKRGNNIFAKFLAVCLRLPIESEKATVTVNFEANAGREKWSRKFGDRRFSTKLRSGNFPGLLIESFGPFSFYLSLVLEKNKVVWHMSGCKILGVKVPKFLTPTMRTFETVKGGRYNFYVRLNLPMIGMLIEYKGWLEIV